MEDNNTEIDHTIYSFEYVRALSTAEKVNVSLYLCHGMEKIEENSLYRMHIDCVNLQVHAIKGVI